MTLSKKQNQSTGDLNQSVGLTGGVRVMFFMEWFLWGWALEKRSVLASLRRQMSCGLVHKWWVTMHLWRIHHDVAELLRGESKVPLGPKGPEGHTEHGMGQMCVVDTCQSWTKEHTIGKMFQIHSGKMRERLYFNSSRIDRNNAGRMNWVELRFGELRIAWDVPWSVVIQLTGK